MKEELLVELVVKIWLIQNEGVLREFWDGFPFRCIDRNSERQDFPNTKNKERYEPLQISLKY